MTDNPSPVVPEYHSDNNRDSSDKLHLLIQRECGMLTVEYRRPDQHQKLDICFHFLGWSRAHWRIGRKRARSGTRSDTRSVQPGRRGRGPGVGPEAGGGVGIRIRIRIAASVNPSSALKCGSPSANLSPPTAPSYCENNFLVEEHRSPV